MARPATRPRVSGTAQAEETPVEFARKSLLRGCPSGECSSAPGDYAVVVGDTEVTELELQTLVEMPLMNPAPYYFTLFGSTVDERCREWTWWSAVHDAGG